MLILVLKGSFYMKCSIVEMFYSFSRRNKLSAFQIDLAIAKLDIVASCNSTRQNSHEPHCKGIRNESNI